MLVEYHQRLPETYAGHRVIAALDPLSLVWGVGRLAETFPDLEIHPDSSFGRDRGLEFGIIFVTVPDPLE